MATKAISKKLRFEVFKRDSFTCQYCGLSAPNVILEADHIHPVSKGGETTITNLITSCIDCNRGKKDRTLSDAAVVEKRKKQLDDLQVRREQIEMMLSWQEELDNLDEEELYSLVDYVDAQMDNHHLNEVGVGQIKPALRKYGLQEMLTSTKISAEQYLSEKDGTQTPESRSKYIQYISKIAAHRQRIKDKPYMGDLYYINGILKNRCGMIYGAVALLEKAYLGGIPIDTLKEIALESRSRQSWNSLMENLINGKTV